ncbi:MAG TPA: T9SS type A sorting domain-containing protein [Candidatus Kapabacteria bacterium]|nr:T9SS type A sorting domain-containing protein [Candidatus Kapabacteria bacterium]
MKTLLGTLLLLLCTSPAWAQITITEADWLGIANQGNNRAAFTATQASLPTLATLASTSSQTWDFTPASYTQNASTGTVTLLTDPSVAPLANDTDFQAATNVIETVPTNLSSPTTYEFIKLTSSGEWILGESEDSSSVLIKVSGLNPPMQIATFPMNYQSTWQSASNEDVPANSLVKTKIAVSAIVDGWGTLITPSPTTSTPALRVKIQTVTTIHEGSHGASDTGYSYEWLTEGLYSATIAYSGFDAAYGVDSSGTINGANYWAPSGAGSVNIFPSLPGDQLHLSLTQNPASNSATNLTYTLQTGGAVQVELMDELGRSVRMLENDHASSGEHSILIDPSTLAPGTYFIRVEANGTSAMRKLVIQ